MHAATLVAIVAVAATAWAPAGLAQAPANGWYLGSGLIPLAPRLLSAGPANPSEPRETIDPGYLQFGGFRFTPTWSMGFGYTGGSRQSASEGSIQSNAWTFSGTGLLPITRSFSLQGRLGVAVPTAEFSLSSAAGTLSSPGNAGYGAEGGRYRMNMLWGVGGQYEVSPGVGLRLEYNSRYADDAGYNRARTDLWSVNAIVRF